MGGNPASKQPRARGSAAALCAEGALVPAAHLRRCPARWSTAGSLAAGPRTRSGCAAPVPPLGAGGQGGGRVGAEARGGMGGMGRLWGAPAAGGCGLAVPRHRPRTPSRHPKPSPTPAPAAGTWAARRAPTCPAPRPSGWCQRAQRGRAGLHVARRQSGRRRRDSEHVPRRREPPAPAPGWQLLPAGSAARTAGQADGGLAGGAVQQHQGDVIDVAAGGAIGVPACSRWAWRRDVSRLVSE